MGMDGGAPPIEPHPSRRALGDLFSFFFFFYSDLWQYKSLRALSSSMRVLFWFSSTATRFSRHLTYSFFFLRHSRAASLCDIETTRVNGCTKCGGQTCQRPSTQYYPDTVFLDRALFLLLWYILQSPSPESHTTAKLTYTQYLAPSSGRISQLLLLF